MIMQLASSIGLEFALLALARGGSCFASRTSPFDGCDGIFGSGLVRAGLGALGYLQALDILAHLLILQSQQGV